MKTSFILTLLLSAFSYALPSGFDEDITLCKNQQELIKSGSVKQLFNAKSKAEKQCQAIVDSTQYKAECEIQCKSAGLLTKCDWQANLIKVPSKPKFDITLSEITPLSADGSKLRCNLETNNKIFMPRNRLLFNCTTGYVLTDTQGHYLTRFDRIPIYLHEFQSGEKFLVTKEEAIILSPTFEVVKSVVFENNSHRGFEYSVLPNDNGVAIYLLETGTVTFFNKDLSDVRTYQVPKGNGTANAYVFTNIFSSAGFGNDVFLVTPDNTLSLLSSDGQIKNLFKFPTEEGPGFTSPLASFIQHLGEAEGKKLFLYSNVARGNEGIVSIDKLNNVSFFPIKGLRRGSSSIPVLFDSISFSSIDKTLTLGIVDSHWHSDQTYSVVTLDQNFNTLKIANSAIQPRVNYFTQLGNGGLVRIGAMTTTPPYTNTSFVEVYGKNGLLAEKSLPGSSSSYFTTYEDRFIAILSEGKTTAIEINRNGCYYKNVDK